ncbi:NAD(P)/FAD-dependent oxidoreductase [Bisbaumannia pacifica]|uniref:FAD-binding oxidoreductase n=1 Tax=Bisbaumannia pacifica TaxID=77098 RepID=A0ABD4L1K5_9GAMM|nr:MULTISPECIES: FAD-dependent oxidoreductase [Halomonas]MBH8579502.1 FAD-binding oxidoreductase [Halomonas pacifica]GKW48994.1 cytochrome c4 [Halomonas sp. NCCP-2165]
MDYPIIVVGAGVVGLNTAIALAKKGHDTCLVDTGVPGAGTSFGNAGIIANYAVMPLITPSLRKSLVPMALDRDSPLSIQSSYALTLAKFGRYFLRATRQREWEVSGYSMGSLMKDAWRCWGEVLEASGSRSLVKSSGVVVAFEKPASFQEFLDIEVQYKQAFDIPYMILEGDEVREKVGGLCNLNSGGVLYPDARFAIDPYALSRHLFEYYLSIGGQFEEARVEAVRAKEKGYSLVLENGERTAQQVVLATGTATRPLLKRLGIDLPIASERGYHAIVDEPIEMARPVGLANHGVFATPMQDGVRIAGLSEFARHDAAASRRRIEQLDRIARHHFGAGIRDPWVGSRTTTPDGVPYVGGLRAHPGLWVNTGHGHLGLTLAAVTARALADEMESGFNALNPFSPHRHL